MKWLDKLLGKPTLERLTDEFCAQLRATGWTDIQPNLAMCEINAAHDGKTTHFYLGNLLSDYTRTRRNDRAALIIKFIDGAAMEGDPVPKDYEEARPSLMPIIRSVGDVGVARLSAERMSEEATAMSPVLHRPFVDDLVLGLVCDMPNAMAWVTEDRLTDWNRSFEQVWDDALQNLRALPEAPGWSELAPGVWSGEWGDAYESSRLLLPDLIYRLGVPEPVAMIPFRNAIVVASAKNPSGVRLLGELVKDSLKDAARWLSFVPLRLHERQWIPHEVPDEDRALFAELRERGRAASYSSQKELLDDMHNADGTGIFVANYQHLQHGDEPVQSYAIWAEGVDTLLPVTELIALKPADTSATPILARWDDVEAAAGELFEATQLMPARVRVRGFPSREVAESLRR